MRRMKKIENSSFDKIQGIGKKIRNKLLNHFGSIDNVKGASLIDLKKVEGIGSSIAEKIYKEFNKNV